MECCEPEALIVSRDFLYVAILINNVIVQSLQCGGFELKSWRAYNDNAARQLPD